MKEYRVARVNGTPDWTKVEALAVEICPWGGNYRPAVCAKVVYEENKGFHVRMCCEEKEPLAVYTQPDDPVCQDSCMEFFADFAPEKGVGYMNLEANSIGTMLLGLGVERHGRARVRELGCSLPELTAFREEGCWGWQAFIPLEMIATLYGKESFAPGDVVRANFYKCGDKTAVEHYIVWNEIAAANPDYHRPECFGSLVIG